LNGFCPAKRLIPAIAIIFGWALTAWTAQPGRLPSIPVTPVDKLPTGERSQRVRVHGTITYYEPGKAVVLENGSGSVWIATTVASGELQIGDEADATGYTSSYNGIPILNDGEIWDDKVQAATAAQPATWQELAAGSHPFDLVSVEGEVVTTAREAARDEMIISSAGQLFTAVYNRLNGAAPQKKIAPGSKIRVTGISIPENPTPLTSQVSVEILLRSPDDLAVVSRPSLLAIRSPSFLLVPMLLVIVALGAWGWRLKGRVSRQASKLAALAYLEQRRSRILGDINTSKPLVEILEKIAELVSFMLGGAACWCDITDGARLGNCPPDVKRLRVLSAEIPARSGPPLGAIFAGLDTGPFPGVRRTFSYEREALAGGAKLAMLAIETRRLYSDLLQRSEVDLLTNVHNRRSMGERMDALIEEARQNASVFGLIYIDLDRFKPINDTYGHHVGDLFLQEVANRMKKQLRSHDLLARLGGDEFAVLLPMVRNRTRIEEIALRLEHCFKEPFNVEGNVLEGSASFGYSMYPEDGATKESLLSAADAAMYLAKNLRKEAAAKREGNQAPANAEQHGG